ncbi:MAG: hypothetical protein ACE5JO_14220 [Candidatus Binatia bacterium]
MTGPNAHWTGLFRLSFEDCRDDTKLTQGQINAAISEGEHEERGFLRFDRESRMIWVIKRLDYEFPNKQMSGTQRAAVATHIKKFPKGSVVLGFLERYKEWGEPFDRLYHGVRDTLSHSPYHGHGYKEEGSKEEGSKGEGSKGEGRRKRISYQYRAMFEEEFETEFWTLWPKTRRISKREAKEAYVESRAKGTPKDEIIKGLRKQIKSKAWQKDQGEFIPHPHRWLKKERWTDEVGAIEDVSPGRRVGGEEPPPPDDEAKARIAELAKGVSEKLRME